MGYGRRKGGLTSARSRTLAVIFAVVNGGALADPSDAVWEWRSDHRLCEHDPAAWTSYTRRDCASIERAKTHHAPLLVDVEGGEYQVDWNKMKQHAKADRSVARAVRRRVWAIGSRHLAEIYENERRAVTLGNSDFSHTSLLARDPSHWTDSKGTVSYGPSSRDSASSNVLALHS